MVLARILLAPARVYHAFKTFNLSLHRCLRRTGIALLLAGAPEDSGLPSLEHETVFVLSNAYVRRAKISARAPVPVPLASCKCRCLPSRRRKRRRSGRGSRAERGFRIGALEPRSLAGRSGRSQNVWGRILAGSRRRQGSSGRSRWRCGRCTEGRLVAAGTARGRLGEHVVMDIYLARWIAAFRTRRTPVFLRTASQ